MVGSHVHVGADNGGNPSHIQNHFHNIYFTLSFSIISYSLHSWIFLLSNYYYYYYFSTYLYIYQYILCANISCHRVLVLTTRINLEHLRKNTKQVIIITSIAHKISDTL